MASDILRLKIGSVNLQTNHNWSQFAINSLKYEIGNAVSIMRVVHVQRIDDAASQHETAVEVYNDPTTVTVLPAIQSNGNLEDHSSQWPPCTVAHVGIEVIFNILVV